MAEESGRAFANLSEMRMQPSPMMSPEQAAAYRMFMLRANATPTGSPVTANLQGTYLSGPQGSQLMLDPSVSANLGDALTVGGGYRTGPMGGVHGRAEIKLPAGLRALLEGSKSGQRAAVAAPVAGGELSATLARMSGQGGMPAQMQGRVGYRIPFAEGGPVRKASGGLSRVNESGNYTKPGMRKRLFNSIKARAVQGTGAGQWSARKAQLLAKSYKEKGGDYTD